MTTFDQQHQADLAAILADPYGPARTAAIGQVRLRIILYPTVSDELSGGTIDHSGPFAFALMADVRAAGLVAGDAGDILTIDGHRYTLLSLTADGQSGAILRLEARG